MRETIGNLLLAVLFAVCSSAGALAQATPSPTQSRQSAQRAADATNAHTEAQQAPSVAAAPRSGSATPGRIQAGTDEASPQRSVTPARMTSASASAASTSVAAPAAADHSGSQVQLVREVFSYESEGRRDPFTSLMSSGELRPMITDLRVATVLYDAGGRSVAVLRDMTTQEQYRVRVGQTLGRMRVVQISPRTVTFTIEEFGFSRQEVLALPEPTKEKSK